MLATTTATATRSTVSDFVAGARAMVPWLAGIVPFGLVIGVSAARADIPTFTGWLTAPLLFGGSAQVIVIDLLDGGATPSVVVLAALAVNLRLVLYSATMAPHWRGTSIGFQALAAYLLVDPTLAVGVDGYERRADPLEGHRHYLGGAAALWVAWLVAVATGATLGARLPAVLHLELVVPLFLAGEVATRITTRAAVHGAAVAVAAAAILYAVPLHLGPVLAIAAGTVAGLHAEEAGKDAAMSAWLVIALAGAGTYLLRISMLVVAARSGVPALIERAAQFAVPTAFGALAATSLAGLVADTGAAALPPVLAVATGAVVACRTGSSRAAIFVGMPTLWVLTAVGG